MAPTAESPSPPLEHSLRQSPRLSRTDLDYLSEWLTKQPHLPRLSDVDLVPFLHSNDYSLEKTKVCLEKYFTMRTHASEMFTHFDVSLPENAPSLDLWYYTELPKKTSQGYKIICNTMRSKDALNYDFDVMSGIIYAYVDILIREDPTCPGYVFIVDATNSSFAHLKKTSITSLSKSMAFFQEALPLHMRAIHVVNVTPVVDAILAVTKPLLSQELQQMLHFHSGSMEKFYEEFPKDILPKEMGGTRGSLGDYHQVMIDKLVERRSWLLELSKKTVDEAKRPGHAKSSGDVFGVEGSFKKLDID